MAVRLLALRGGPRKIPEAQSKAIVLLEGLDKLKKKKSNDPIGNRTHDPPACSV
jgi:hypothetical protein